MTEIGRATRRAVESERLRVATVEVQAYSDAIEQNIALQHEYAETLTEVTKASGAGCVGDA